MEGLVEQSAIIRWIGNYTQRILVSIQVHHCALIDCQGILALDVNCCVICTSDPADAENYLKSGLQLEIGRNGKLSFYILCLCFVRRLQAQVQVAQFKLRLLHKVWQDLVLLTSSRSGMDQIFSCVSQSFSFLGFSHCVCVSKTISQSQQSTRSLNVYLCIFYRPRICGQGYVPRKSRQVVSLGRICVLEAIWLYMHNYSRQISLQNCSRLNVLLC